MISSSPSRSRLRPVGLSATALAVLALVAAGCGDDEGAGSADGGDAAITVVATTTHLADFVREVGGDRVDVVQLLQPNTDPHDYEPRPQDIRRASEAEVMFVSGDELDEWAADVADQAGLPDSAVVDAGATRPVKLEGDHDHGDDEDGDDHADEKDGDDHADEKDGDDHGDDEEIDPHWWHDPRNARASVLAIRDALVKVDADGAATYRANATAYAREVEALDEEIAACFAAVPDEQRKLVSDHEAFTYLTERYDIEFVGAIIPSTTSQAQPSAGAIGDRVKAVKSEGVGAIFPESSLNPALAKTIADRTGARVGETLFADTLGPADEPGGTYLGSMRENARALVEGFTAGASTCGAGDEPAG